MPAVQVPGVGPVMFPDEMTHDQIVEAIEKDILPKYGPKPKTNAMRDVPASFVAGVGSAVEGVGALAGLPFGAIDNPLSRAGKWLDETASEYKSEGLRAKEAAMARRLEEAKDKGLLEQTKEGAAALLDDLYLAGMTGVQTLPSLLGSAGSGLVARVGAKGAVKAAEMMGGRLAAERLAARLPLDRVALQGSIAGGTALQTGDVVSDTYKDVMEQTQSMTNQEEREALATRAARQAALIAAPVSYGTARLLPGVEHAMFGKGSKAGLTGRVASGAAGEFAQEYIEEGSGRFARNVGASEVDPERSLMQGVGTQAIQGGIMGGIMGGGTSAVTGRRGDVEGRRREEEDANLRSALQTLYDTRDPEQQTLSLGTTVPAKFDTPYGVLDAEQLLEFARNNTDAFPALRPILEMEAGDTRFGGTFTEGQRLGMIADVLRQRPEGSTIPPRNEDVERRQDARPFLENLAPEDRQIIEQYYPRSLEDFATLAEPTRTAALEKMREAADRVPLALRPMMARLAEIESRMATSTKRLERISLERQRSELVARISELDRQRSDLVQEIGDTAQRGVESIVAVPGQEPRLSSDWQRQVGALAERIGEDPVALVTEYMPGITERDFLRATPDARERLVAAAQEKRATEGDERRTLYTNFDASNAEGIASPTSRPNAPADSSYARGNYEATSMPVQPTSTEIEMQSSPNATQRQSANQSQAKVSQLAADLDYLMSQQRRMTENPYFVDLRRKKSVGTISEAEASELTKMEIDLFGIQSKIEETRQQAATLSRSAGFGSRTASGTSDRPFPGFEPGREALAEGGDEGRVPQPGETQAEFFERIAKERAEAEYQREWQRILYEWEARTRAKEEASRDQADAAQAESRYSDATNDPGRADADGFWSTDADGFMVNDGNLVAFASKKAAAQWMARNKQAAYWDLVVPGANSDTTYLRARPAHARDRADAAGRSRRDAPPNTGAGIPGPQYSAMDTDGTARAQSTTPRPESGTKDQQRERAWTIINGRLNKLRAQGRQGRLAAADLTKAIKDGNLTPEQGVAAFRIAEQVVRFIGGDKMVRFDFTRELAPINVNGVEIEPQALVKEIMQTPAGISAVMRFSLSPRALPLAGQTAPHEAFHLLQSLFKKSDQRIDQVLAKAFPEGKNIDGIDPVLLRKMKTTKSARGISYYELLKKAIPNETRSAELQAYTFGALVDAKINGTAMTGLTPTLLRFVNFLATMKQRVGAALRGDGITAAGVFDQAERGGYGSLNEIKNGDARDPIAATEQYSALNTDSLEQYSAAPMSVEEKIHGIARQRPNVFTAAMRTLMGAKETSIYGDGRRLENLGDAFVRGSINRAHSFHILAKTLEKGGQPQFKDLGRIVETSLNNAGRIEATVMFGPPTYDPKTGDIAVHQDVPGLMDIYRNIKPSQQQALQRYYVALRERDLRKQGRVGFANLTDKEVVGIIQEAEANHPEWKDVARQQDTFNKALLDLMVKTGVLDQKQANAMGALFHTPFYRLMDQDNDADPNRVMGPGASDTLNNPSSFLKKLDGGTEPIGGLYENLLRNADAITRASLKNVAMQQATAAMEAAGLARAVKGDNLAKGESMLTFRRDGQSVTYAIDDPVLYASIAGLPARSRTGLEKAVIGFGSFFRDMITAAPSFMLANLWRGKVVAYVQEGLPFYTNTFDGIKQALTGSTSLKRIMMETGFGGFDFGMSPRDNAKAFERHLRLKQGEATAWDRVRGVMDGLLRISEATEMAERIKLYERLVAQGMDERNAAYQSYLLAPFSRRGTGEGLAGETLSWLTPMVPFLNAKMQSLYRVVENEKGDKRVMKFLPQQIFLRGLLLTAFSAAAFAWSAGDDRWDEETVDRKMMYDIIYMGDKTFYLPRAFEYGSLFGTLPVFALDAFRRKDGSDLAKMAASVGTSTFFFNPIPPALQPILNVAFNYDMFRGRELETKGEQALPVAERSNRFTTGGAELLAGAVNNTLGQMPRGARVELSPIRAQALLDGYLGSTGTIILNAFDSMAAMAGMRTAKPTDAFGDPASPVGLAATLSGVKRFVKSDDERVTRFVGDFYTIKQEVDGVVRLMNDAKAAGDMEKMREIMSDNRPALAINPALAKIGRRIGELNRQMKVIERQGGDPEEMAQRLTPLRQMRNQIARRGVELAKEMGVH